MLFAMYFILSFIVREMLYISCISCSLISKPYSLLVDSFLAAKFFFLSFFFFLRITKLNLGGFYMHIVFVYLIAKLKWVQKYSVLNNAFHAVESNYSMWIFFPAGKVLFFLVWTRSIIQVNFTWERGREWRTFPRIPVKQIHYFLFQCIIIVQEPFHLKYRNDASRLCLPFWTLQIQILGVSYILLGNLWYKNKWILW